MRQKVERWCARAILCGLCAFVAAGAGGCLITYDPDSVELEGGDTRPRVNVLQPVPQQEVGDDLLVELDVRNFALVAPDGRANAPNEGHVLAFIDGAAVAGGVAIVTASFHITGLDDTLSHDEGANVHRLRIEVHQNDGTPYDENPGPVEVDFIKLPPAE
jgi:hypothetical protein